MKEFAWVKYWRWVVLESPQLRVTRQGFERAYGLCRTRALSLSEIEALTGELNAHAA